MPNIILADWLGSSEMLVTQGYGGSAFEPIVFYVSGSISSGTFGYMEF